MENLNNESVQKNTNSGLSNIFATIAVVLCIVFGFVVWNFVLGNPSNFVDNDPSKDPVSGNLLGMMYKGGYVIGVLIGLLTMTVVFGIERWIVISKASGSGNIKAFVAEVQSLIRVGKVNEAIELCDTQKGSVANVVKAALIKYDTVKKIWRKFRRGYGSYPKRNRRGYRTRNANVGEKHGSIGYFGIYRYIDRSFRNSNRYDQGVLGFINFRCTRLISIGNRYL